MKPLSGSDRHIYRELMEKTDKRAAELLKMGGTETIVLERVANVIVVRLRRFIRGLDEKELYEFVSKEMNSLKRLKAKERHYIVSMVIEFMI